MFTGTVDFVLAGGIANAPSANTILGPLSHLNARIVPIYTLQPTAPVASSSFTTELISGSVYQTHGLWCTGTYGDIITSMSMSNFCGHTRDQFSIGCTTEYDHRIVLNRMGSVWSYLELEGGIKHGLTSSQEIQEGSFSAFTINPTLLSQISRGAYNPTQYQARYGEFAYSQFTTMDLGGAIHYENNAAADEIKSVPVPRQFTTLLSADDVYDEANGGWITSSLTSSMPSDATLNDTQAWYFIDRFTAYAINAVTVTDPTA
jgi:hypothetical protein